MDKRLTLLSYSSLLTLHSCPRKFQLYRLNSTIVESEDKSKSSLTFAYGHTVGTGIQDTFTMQDEDQILFKAFCEWETDLLEENPKQNKSFWEAVIAIQTFLSMKKAGFLDDYEILYYKGQPACELSFQINILNEFIFRGSIDAVLKHKTTGKITVLEVKTTSSTTLNPATYKNSSQALGYSVILDTISPGLSSYSVIYLVYKTKTREFELLEFNKSMHQRALWIRELLLDCDVIKLYNDTDVFPTRGESCYTFFRECEYLGICTLNTARLVSPEPIEEEWNKKIEDEEKQFSIKLDLKDLIESQVELDYNFRHTEIHSTNTHTLIKDDYLEGDILL